MPEIDYLGGREDPSGTPPFGFPDNLEIMGAGGVDVIQGAGQVSIGFKKSFLDAIEGAAPPPTSDPFSDMAFRCSWSDEGADGSIVVKKGYISHTYWDATDGWITDQFPIAEETVALSSPSYPMFFYLVVPVAMVTVTDDTTGPYEEYDGSASPIEIEGTDYDFFAECATSWLSLDQTPPGSYFLATDTPPTADATHYRLLLAEIPEEGSVRQKTFGDVKLPQRSVADITLLNVAPH